MTKGTVHHILPYYFIVFAV